MHAPATRMTAEEYLEVPWEQRRFSQLIDGEVVVNQPSPGHQVVLGRLHVALALWVESEPRRGIAILPIDVRMTAHDVYGPDLSWFSGEQVAEHGGDVYVQVPTLVAEVRSPSTWRYDIGRKLSVYEAGGVRELWLVDIEADTVLVYRRSTPKAERFDEALELSQELSSPLLPGFRAGLPDLFRPAP
jgi:Uma2 family endonuclease